MVSCTTSPPSLCDQSTEAIVRDFYTGLGATAFIGTGDPCIGTGWTGGVTCDEDGRVTEIDQILNVLTERLTAVPWGVSWGISLIW